MTSPDIRVLTAQWPRLPSAASLGYVQLELAQVRTIWEKSASPTPCDPRRDSPRRVSHRVVHDGIIHLHTERGAREDEINDPPQVARNMARPGQVAARSLILTHWAAAALSFVFGRESGDDSYDRGADPGVTNHEEEAHELEAVVDH